jgi:large subunit ribosomal protein L24
MAARRSTKTSAKQTKAAAAAAARPRSMKIRSGDQVQVISGKDRGKSGRVLRADPRRGRVYVEGLNMVKRHIRPQHSSGASGQDTAAQLGGVIEREGPIHISNVMLLDPKGQPTRVRIERSDEGSRSRVVVRSGATID